ncbi:unnamed protein product [Microthlaspi erraticum]|uniref:Uncharacterized protein n=1 Tax=Microthlaspi erraticum TaxID=1685480 RepID=A0A6D2KUT9_9BRAS|nr:unnamed protein product [Microthlaspi erraticum]
MMHMKWIGDSDDETVEVINGFQVPSSQVKQVRRIFEKHPSTASDFRPKSQQLKKAYIDILLDLIGTLCRWPHELTDEDLDEAHNSISDLEDVGFKLYWLKMKLWKVYVKKKQEKESSVRIRKLQEEVEKQKLVLLYFENELKIEKDVIADTRAPLYFSDVV